MEGMFVTHTIRGKTHPFGSSFISCVLEEDERKGTGILTNLQSRRIVWRPFLRLILEYGYVTQIP